MQTTPVKYSPKQHADVPAAWKRAAGILRTSAKKNIAELKKLRKEWNKRA